jgi:ElaB/YqjD/DUF883 family membrane-anchored ribosome-binding protein
MASSDPEGDDKTDGLQNRALKQGAAALATAGKHAQHAMESAKAVAAGAHLDEVGARAAETASNLYRGGRDLVASNADLSQVAENLSAAVRKNPLAAVGVAFSAGLVLALLLRR